VGENNFGHPSGDLIDFFDQSGTKYLRTDKDGDILFETDGKEINELKPDFYKI
jgi:beta-lactamase superfamily II metal-dependent hydrolase